MLVKENVSAVNLRFTGNRASTISKRVRESKRMRRGKGESGQGKGDVPETITDHCSIGDFFDEMKESLLHGDRIESADAWLECLPRNILKEGIRWR